MRKSKSAIVFSTIAVALAIAGITFAYSHESIFNASSFQGNTVSFVIVESSSGPLEGMNGSYYHAAPWPLIHVSQGDKVVIHVMNEASSEPHGFAINRYFPQGATIQAGHSYTVSFIANEKGNFTMYCDIFCSVHVFMQNGLLSVT